MVRIPDFAPAFGRPPNSYDGMRTIMLVHQPFFLFLHPPLFPVHPFFLTTAGESWSCLPLNDQRVCVSWLEKKKKKNVNVARRRRRRRFAECEDETKRKKEFWWKLEWKVERKKERKKESKLRFENMNVCIFVTRREYLIKRKKKNHSYRAIYLIN